MNLLKKYEDQNKGLPTRFRLNDKGGFLLLGGRAKVDDNVSMLLAFIGWFRLFSQDYIIDIYRFYQNTTSYIYQFKNILRLDIMEIGRKYLPFAQFEAVDIPLDYTNRKETSVLIQFKYRLKNVDEYQTIKRVII